MFDTNTIVSTRERAAVLALMARQRVEWNRLAGAIEEAGSALALLDHDENHQDGRLFEVETAEVTLDQLEERVIAYEREGIGLVTVLDATYPMNLRMVHDRPPALFFRGRLVPDDERSVAVVGSRKASAEGLEKASEIARRSGRSRLRCRQRPRCGHRYGCPSGHSRGRRSNHRSHRHRPAAVLPEAERGAAGSDLPRERRRFPVLARARAATLDVSSTQRRDVRLGAGHGRR